MNNDFGENIYNLIVTNRDPEIMENAFYPFWINFNTKELFQYTRQGWHSLTKEYIKLYQFE